MESKHLVSDIIWLSRSLFFKKNKTPPPSLPLPSTPPPPPCFPASSPVRVAEDLCHAQARRAAAVPPCHAHAHGCGQGEGERRRCVGLGHGHGCGGGARVVTPRAWSRSGWWSRSGCGEEGRGREGARWHRRGAATQARARLSCSPTRATVSIAEDLHHAHAWRTATIFPRHTNGGGGRAAAPRARVRRRVAARMGARWGRGRDGVCRHGRGSKVVRRCGRGVGARWRGRGCGCNGGSGKLDGD